MHKRTLAALGLVLAIVVGSIPFQPTKALTLIPPSLEFNSRPGEKIPTKIKLFNETTAAVELFSSTANFTAKDETGTPEFDTVATPSEGLASWMKLGAGPFKIEPGQFIEVPVEITVPADAPPGGHFAGVFFSPQAPAQENNGQIAIGAKIGALVLVRVEGQINEIAAFEEFSGPTGTPGRPPVTFVVRVKNAGNVHVRPTGDITIRNMLGGTTMVVPINSTQGAVLPQSIRRFDSTWQKSATTAQTGNFFTEVANEWKNFAFGPYTATANLTYGQAKDKTLTAVVNFWIFPWRIMLVFVVGLALIVGLLVVGIKRYNQWIIAKAKTPPTGGQ